MLAMTDQNYEPSPWEPIAEHVERYLATDGEDGAVWEGAPTIILTTTGARSGKTRRTPLIRVTDGDRYLVVASMGGEPRGHRAGSGRGARALGSRGIGR